MDIKELIEKQSDVKFRDRPLTLFGAIYLLKKKYIITMEDFISFGKLPCVKVNGTTVVLAGIYSRGEDEVLVTFDQLPRERRTWSYLEDIFRFTDQLQNVKYKEAFFLYAERQEGEEETEFYTCNDVFTSEL